MSQQQLRVSSLLVSRKAGVESAATAAAHNSKEAIAAALPHAHQQAAKRKYAEQAPHTLLEEELVAAPSARPTRSSSRAATPVRSSSRLSRSSSNAASSDADAAAATAPAVAQLAAAPASAPAPVFAQSKRKASFEAASTGSKRSRMADTSDVETQQDAAVVAEKQPQQQQQESAVTAAPVRAMSDVAMGDAREVLPALESAVPTPAPAAEAVAPISVAVADEMMVESAPTPVAAPVAAAPLAPGAGRYSRGAAMLAMSQAATSAAASARPAAASSVRWNAASAAAAAAVARASLAAPMPAPVVAQTSQQLQEQEDEEMLSRSLPMEQSSSLSLVQPLAPSFSATPSAVASSSSSAAAAAHRPLLVAPAFKSSADLQSRLSGLLKGVLPFPTALSELIQVFHAVDTALMLEKNRAAGSYPPTWEKLQPSVQRLHPKRTVGIGMVQQLLSLYPRCYSIEERHLVDKFGKLQRGYKIAFGDTNELGDEEDDEAVKAALMTQRAAGAAAAPVDLEGRRRAIETRMLHYVYEHHQRFLQRLAQQMQHDSIVATSASQAGNPAVPTAASAVAAFLAAPLSRLRCWYPGFQLDSPAHVPPPALEALPETQLNSMLARAAHTDSGAGLLQLANRRQPVPARMSLHAEQRGVQSSTSHGSALAVRVGTVKEERPALASFSAVAAAASASASASASAAAAAAASAAPAPAPQHKDLSVLSPALVLQFRANLARTQAASTALHGDPAERERLRQLLKLRPLYEAITFRMRGEGRPNMPLAELMRKLRSGGEWPDESALRAAIALLVQLIPSWCSIGTSGVPPREIFRTQPSPRLCIDAATGQDKHVQRLDKAVRECEEGLAAAAAAASAPPVAPVPVAAAAAAAAASAPPAAASAPLVADATEVRVKIEDASEMMDESAVADSAVIVKQECVVPSPAAVAAATSALAHRVASSPAALRVPVSPLKGKGNVSGRAAMLAKAAARTQASPAPKPKPSAAGSLAARLSNMR